MGQLEDITTRLEALYQWSDKTDDRLKQLEQRVERMDHQIFCHRDKFRADIDNLKELTELIKENQPDAFRKLFMQGPHPDNERPQDGKKYSPTPILDMLGRRSGKTTLLKQMVAEKADNQVEADKVLGDMNTYGIGLMRDGKHVPTDGVFIGLEPRTDAEEESLLDTCPCFGGCEQCKPATPADECSTIYDVADYRERHQPEQPEPCPYCNTIPKLSAADDDFYRHPTMPKDATCPLESIKDVTGEQWNSICRDVRAGRSAKVHKELQKFLDGYGIFETNQEIREQRDELAEIMRGLANWWTFDGPLGKIQQRAREYVEAHPED
ncbi:hypothetical protein [Oceanidesulfovibrio marinus]|uniref:Uncharacterized protein n=1 Tax=Oceanidesulfovibrio marinus TaxID=370038 RepID=A0A6P1ZDU8_9BACT|nr:hypothetical protein [Oceanidesulfovibrio marinus]TVM31197.1 hypothetical protein DQK91_18985 [Oceanidesulfovibrio marinus]